MMHDGDYKALLDFVDYNQFNSTIKDTEDLLYSTLSDDIVHLCTE